MDDRRLETGRVVPLGQRLRGVPVVGRRALVRHRLPPGVELTEQGAQLLGRLVRRRLSGDPGQVRFGDAVRISELVHRAVGDVLQPLHVLLRVLEREVRPARTVPADPDTAGQRQQLATGGRPAGWPPWGRLHACREQPV